MYEYECLEIVVKASTKFGQYDSFQQRQKPLNKREKNRLAGQDFLRRVLKTSSSNFFLLFLFSFLFFEKFHSLQEAPSL